jgi:hypothetical protein
MGQQLLLLIALIFVQLVPTSSIVRAQMADVELLLHLIADTADRICGVIKDEGSAGTATARGVLNVELQGLALQAGTAALQATGGITSEQYKGVLREQLGPVLGKTTDCKLKVFDSLQDKLLPGYKFRSESDSTQVRRPAMGSNVGSNLLCQAEQLTQWLDEHGVYGGDRPFDISIYADQVGWTVNGKPSKKTRSQIAKEEEVWKRLYPIQKYTPMTSSATMIGGQCVLTQRVEGYKKSSTGKVELDYFKLGFGIRTDANGPLIVERQTDVLRQ